MFWKLGWIMNDKLKWVGRVLKNGMKLKLYRFHLDTIDGKQKIKCGLAISWRIICSYTWEGEMIELTKVGKCYIWNWGWVKWLWDIAKEVIGRIKRGFIKIMIKRPIHMKDRTRRPTHLSIVQNEGIEGSHVYELSRGSYNYELQIWESKFLEE